MRRIRIEPLQRLASLMAVLLALVASDFSSEAQMLLSSRRLYDDTFERVAVTSNGTVVVLASTDGGSPFIYEFAGTNLQVYQPPHLSEIPDASEVAMSRDGEHFVAEYDAGYWRGVSLWKRSMPDELLIITNARPSISSAQDVISLPDGPMIIANGYPASMLWRPLTGWLPCASNTVPDSYISLIQGAGDGKQFAGNHYISTNQSRPLRIKNNNVRYLPTRGTINRAFNISPNGRFVSGIRNGRATIWYNGTFFHLPGPTPSVAEFVTDSGFATVYGNDEVKIYDPRTRKAYPFMDWWRKYYPTVTFPVPITDLNDLYEHAGILYFLVSGRVDELSHIHNYVAVAPLNRPKRYKM